MSEIKNAAVNNRTENKNSPNGADAQRLYSYLPMLSSPRAYALISTDALIHNFNVMRQKARGHNENAVLIATVKADAYGHSAAICVPALLGAGCRFFAVSSMEEALDVRHIIENEKIVDADILILGYTDPRHAALAAEHNITLSLVSEAHASAIISAIPAGKKVKVHVAIDTGMNRLGFPAHTSEDIEQTAEKLTPLFFEKKLEVCGAFSHFFNADSEGAEDTTYAQNRNFLSVIYQLTKRGVSVPLTHICNTAGIMLYTPCTLDAVRMGISLYGSVPYGTSEAEKFVPVMKLCSIVSHIHTVKKGETVGYGGTYRAENDIVCATIPIGYADGFVRAYSGAEVTVGGKKAKIIGRICMDQCMIDITGIENVKVGDEVVLFGNSPDELKSLAERAGTIEYECLCLISSRIPRIKV